MPGLHLGMGLGLQSAAAAAGPSPELFGSLGDSIGVGILVRTGGVDLAWANTYNVRDRAPAGVTTSLPYDQAIAPTGFDYLSPMEYLVKQRTLDNNNFQTGVVPHGWNGTRIGATFDWGITRPLTEAFITRFNASVVTARASYSGTLGGGIVHFLGTNDANAGGASAQFQTDTVNMINDVRSRCFQNGVSGATMASKPYIIVGILPEFITSADNALYQQALMYAAGTISGCMFYQIPEGNNHTDNTHPSLAGNRVVGGGLAALLNSTSSPTMTGIAASGAYTNYASQKMLIELTSSAYAYWTTSNTTDFEIIWLTDGTSGIGLSRMRQYLRYASDGTKAAGTYTTTLTAKGANGRSTSITWTNTVVAAYGSQVETVTATHQSFFDGAVTNDLRSRANIPVTVGAGMNVIFLTQKAGSATNITSMFFNGIAATKSVNSSGMTQIWYLPVAQAQSGNLLITDDGPAGITQMACHVVSLRGTVAAESTANVLVYGFNNSPHLTASLTVPSNGIAICGGLIPGLGTDTGGQTRLATSGNDFTASRTTTGVMGATGTNGAFSFVAATAFAKA